MRRGFCIISITEGRSIAKEIRKPTTASKARQRNFFPVILNSLSVRRIKKYMMVNTTSQTKKK